MSYGRMRDYGIVVGHIPTGPYNAITDVPGVVVGHYTDCHDLPNVARTGVTVVIPREDTIWNDYVFAGYYSQIGFGEMTGLQWLDKSGELTSAVAITNTCAVGVAHDALVAYTLENSHLDKPLFPVVAETYDGWLNDITAFHINKTHVYEALAVARGGPVLEGNVGAGTGAICYEFKGGIGTSSRLVRNKSVQYTVGVLLQANFGDRFSLQVDGVPVGREISLEHTPTPWETSQYRGSAIVIIATDAPLLSVQCKRLAKGAAIGLTRMGSIGKSDNGDICLAFATGNHLIADSTGPRDLKMLPDGYLDIFVEAAAEAVEEAVLNALTAAETMIGFQGHLVHALPLDELQKVMEKYGRRA